MWSTDRKNNRPWEKGPACPFTVFGKNVYHVSIICGISNIELSPFCSSV